MVVLRESWVLIPNYVQKHYLELRNTEYITLIWFTIHLKKCNTMNFYLHIHSISSLSPISPKF